MRTEIKLMNGALIVHGDGSIGVERYGEGFARPIGGFEDAVKLRDALLELYPLEHRSAPKREFTVGDDWDFEFGYQVRETVQRQGVDVKTIGYFPERQDAEWAVQALNERNEREAA